MLGPTNTGKTHYAIERMLAHKSGMIGLPLRLLAREVYQRVVEKAGEAAVALITGEEKIKPKAPRYWVSTVEAMPRDLDLAFVAVDEIQLCADLDRGHVFTDRLLNRRGLDETLLIGAATMQRPIEELLPGAPILSRPRLSTLSFSGDRKISRLPPRSAIVAFSVEEVYAIAEWIRRLRGGAAVVLGALSPRTRNAQVEMFQSGEVDYIIATDAIGMGLNLDVDHIAFASDRKFDGWQFRQLTPAEFGQIAGRAGRHMRDGTFGTTGRCPPFVPELVEALENHRFDPVTLLQWRNTELDFSTISELVRTLDRQPGERRLTRAPVSEDQMVLDIACRDENVVRQAKTPADVARLWETCQIPDYRKLSPAAHAELCLSIYGFVVRAGHIPEDWFARHLAQLDRMDGDLDTLSARIAQVRTWTFVANRSRWLRHPEHWQGVTRQVEDRLSDALHERLAQRFVDRRTSVLMRRLRENAMLEAEITPSGDVMVEGQHVGHLSGFVFSLVPQAAGEEAKTLQAAAQKALASEFEGRAKRVNEAVDESIVLANDGIVRWLGEAIGKIVPGEHVLEPQITVLADEQLTGQLLEMVQRRLDLWLAQHVRKLLGPLMEIEKGEGLESVARGIAFQIGESLGVLDRAQVADVVKNLPQEARASLRKLGVRFGAYHLYLPALLKPAPRALAAQLWALKQAGVSGGNELAEVPHLAASGRTSFPADKNIAKGFYRAAGFRVCGDRAVRVDILERLADLIRPAIGYRPGTTPGNPPPGAADGDGFVVTVNMTSLTGCSGESFATILRSLGYVSANRQGPAITVPLLAAAPIMPVQPVSAGLPQPAASALAEAEAAAAPGETPTAETPAEQQVGEAAVDEMAPLQTAETDAGEAVPAATFPEASAAEAAEIDTSTTDSQQSCAATAGEDKALLCGSDVTAVSAPTEEMPGAAPSEDVSPAPQVSAAAEAALIEVWRPQRQHHNQRRDHKRQRPIQRHDLRTGNGREAAPGTSETETSQGGDRNQARQGPPRRSFKLPVQARVSTETQASSEPSAALPNEFVPVRPREDRKDERREGSAGDGKHRQGRRNDERRDRRQGSFGNSEKAAGRERQPDPNSPFAKLLILKQQWENQSNKT